MQVKNRKFIISLNSAVVITIFFNKSFWGNISNIYVGVDPSTLGASISELIFPVLIYLGSVMIVFFCIDRRMRNSFEWVNINLCLNLMPVIAVILLALFF